MNGYDIICTAQVPSTRVLENSVCRVKPELIYGAINSLHSAVRLVTYSGREVNFNCTDQSQIEFYPPPDHDFILKRM